MSTYATRPTPPASPHAHLASDITGGDLPSTTYTAPNLNTAGNPDSLITLKVSTDLNWEAVSVTGSTTKALEVIDLDSSTGVITRILPAVVGAAGQRFKYVVENTASLHTATVQAASGETILGVVDGSRTLSLSGDYIEFFSTGSNWIILIDQVA